LWHRTKKIKLASALQQCDTRLMKSWRAIDQIVMRGCSACTLEGTNYTEPRAKGSCPNWRHASDISLSTDTGSRQCMPFLRREE
jgi:hypothetical protein